MPKTDKLAGAFFTVGREIKEAVLQSPDLKLSYIRLMALNLVKRICRPSMKELADHLCISSPSTTKIINELVRQGNLKRIVDSSDRRVIRHVLTKKGQENLKTGFKVASRISEKIFSRLSGEERKTLLKILNKIIK